MKVLSSKITRLINVAGVAAIGHLLSVLLIPYASKYFGSEVASQIAVIDSSFLLISTMLAFGLSLTVTRDVSQTEKWKSKVSKCLSARVVLAVLIQAVSGLLYYLGFIDKIAFICFLLSPLIALNLDFVLYGRDMPVRAAYASFIRMSLPVLFFISLPLILRFNIDYLLLVVVFYLCSTLFVFKSLGFYPNEIPKISSILNYKPVIFIGLASLFIAFQRLGFISFLDVSQTDLVYISTVLKFYLAFVAVRRLFIQTFYVSLLKRSIYVKVEVFCFISALIVASVCFIFPEKIAVLLFSGNSDSQIEYIVFFAILLIAGSLFATADARLFLENKDRSYYASAFISFFIWLVCFSLFFIQDSRPAYILLILALSEAILALSYKYFLVKK